MDTTSCRRKRILAYFGDDYPPDNCNSCDCCLASTDSDILDVTDTTISTINLLVSMINGGRRIHWTKHQLVAAIRGRKSASRQYHGKGFGCQLRLHGGQIATVEQTKAFISTLIHKQLIAEYTRNVPTGMGKSFSQIYIKVGVFDIWISTFTC
jgi:superfamily II DNA helicase RecQ